MKTKCALTFFAAITTKTALKLLDELEPIASAGGVILDWHTCELFPERWADLVVVLRCDHTKLWERLEKRYVSINVTLSTLYIDPSMTEDIR